MDRKVSAVDIKRIWYMPIEKITAKPTPKSLYGLLYPTNGDATVKEVKNVHQETWKYEEGEASQDSYKNQLTRQPYRVGAKAQGEVAFTFTIGQYDFQTKQDFMGGNVVTEKDSTQKDEVVGWERAALPEDIYYTMVALTTDNVYIVFPKASVAANGADTDKAVGIAVKTVALQPDIENVNSEYWFDGDKVVAGA